jgi:hypothetical protein
MPGHKDWTGQRFGRPSLLWRESLTTRFAFCAIAGASMPNLSQKNPAFAIGGIARASAENVPHGAQLRCQMRNERSHRKCLPPQAQSSRRSATGPFPFSQSINPRREQLLVLCICGISDKGSPNMHAADRFLKFATECQAMAQLAPQKENKRVWNSLAERWRRCAKLTEQLDTDLSSCELKRKKKHLKIVTH